MDSKETTKENIEPLDLAHSLASSRAHDDECRQITVLFEYKILQMYGPMLGIYAIPNLDNYMIWNCILFVRKGFYKDGKFKFDMAFHADFPKSPPQITFKSAVFHPLIKEADGTVDISSLLEGEEWNYSNENMLYNLLLGLQKIFTEKQKMEIKTSYNPEAARMLASKPHSFIEKALSSVELSQDRLYVNEPGNSLIFNKYEKNELQQYKQKIEVLCQENRAPEEKRKQFLSFLLEE